MKTNLMYLLSAMLMVFLLNGCATSKYNPPFTESLVFDFREYSEKGFLITPEKYTGDYESIGLIELSIYPAAARQSEIPKPHEISPKDYIQGYWLIAKINPDELVKQIYERANEMGADAVMNFRVTTISKQVEKDLNLTGFNVSGFAIKRK